MSTKTEGRVSMRIPTDEEWDKIMDTVRKDDAIVHWKDMYSWVDDPTFEEDMMARAIRGYYSARSWDYIGAAYQSASLGFRPVFEGLNPDSLSSDSQDGDAVVVGTLYMNGNPVRVPQKPTWDGDIEDYIPGTKLEMRPALDDPAYQVTAIKVGEAFIADRNLLKRISYMDIE